MEIRHSYRKENCSMDSLRDSNHSGFQWISVDIAADLQDAFIIGDFVAVEAFFE
jgi:hypothetical protein